MPDDEKIMDMIATQQEEQGSKLERKMELRSKIMQINQMQALMETMMQSSDDVIRMKAIALDGKINSTDFRANSPSIQFNAKNFELSSKLDKDNEKRPKSPTKTKK